MPSAVTEHPLILSCFSHVQLLFHQQSNLSAALAQWQGTIKTPWPVSSQTTFSLALKPQQVRFEMYLPWEGSAGMSDTKSCRSGGVGAADAQQNYFELP